MISLIRFFPLTLRKDLLLMTRVRTPVSHSAFLPKHLHHMGSKRMAESTDNRVVVRFDAYYIQDIFSTFIDVSEWMTSFYSMLLRNLPYGDNYLFIENQARVQSFAKEFEATQRGPQSQKLNYSFLFGDFQSPLSVFLPSRPHISEYVFDRFNAWKVNISRQLIYPRYSSKSVGRTTAAALRSRSSFALNQQSVSTLDLERHYHVTGEVIEGPVEMRQAWFMNDLKPRTYFAQGGDSYASSKYIQEPFNLLLDCLPHTHRKSRFDLDRLDVAPHDTVLVYDFSSFTSSMTEQTHFISALANFCVGTQVNLLDTRLGIVTHDLGKLLHDYNSRCNTRPVFEISQELRDLSGYSDIIYYHETAGFLGVHGNLASCTCCHGLTLLHLVGNVRKCSCVGDDAIGIIYIRAPRLELGEVEILRSVDSHYEALRDIGSIHPEKTAELGPIEDYERPDEVWTYLKRSLKRTFNGLSLTRQHAYPSFALAMYKHFRTTRKPRYELNDHNVIPRLVTQISSFLLSIFNNKPSTLDICIAVEYLRLIYEESGLPCHGYLIQQHTGNQRTQTSYSHCLFVPWIPQATEDLHYLTDFEPLENLLRVIDFDQASLPVTTFKRIEPDYSWVPGSTFTGCSTKLLKILRDLGYVTQSPMMQTVGREDALRYFQDFLSIGSQVVYEFTVLAEVPAWTIDVVMFTHLRVV